MEPGVEQQKVVGGLSTRGVCWIAFGRLPSLIVHE
jgi:hypothetical protein